MYNTNRGYNAGRMRYRGALIRGRPRAPLNRRRQVLTFGRRQRVIRRPSAAYMQASRRRYAGGFARMARRFPVGR